MEIAGYIIVAVAAYLLGSIPTGYLAARAKGIDIRTVGSGNIGATNAFRVLGKPMGVFVLLADAAKGWLACACLSVWIGQLFFAEEMTQSDHLPVTLKIIAGLAAVIGHNYTCWLRFKGGKGIATSAGVLIALVPWALLIILTIWIVLFLATRYVSVGSVAAATTLPFATWFTTDHNLSLTIVTGVMGALAVYRHRGNIQRLRNGTENRINFKKKDGAK